MISKHIHYFLLPFLDAGLVYPQMQQVFGFSESTHEQSMFTTSHARAFAQRSRFSALKHFITLSRW